MTFSEGGNFGGGRVRTSRGGRGARGGAVGGGIGAIVVLVGALFFGVDLSPVVNGVAGAGGGGSVEEGTLGPCTAEQANVDRECRLVATVDSLDTFWAEALPAAGVQYVQPGVESFQGQVDTACGAASSATGPFYCPADQSVYLDLGFYDDLQSRFGASGGNLSEMYVLAHEFGHHVQQLTGVFAAADRSGSGPESDSVRVELMADCLAGMWAGHAASTVDPDTGVTYLEPITQTELADALSAAAAVGDDRIQQSSGGGVDPHSWTHGSSEQRQRWFVQGYENGTLSACNTLDAAQL